MAKFKTALKWKKYYR